MVKPPMTAPSESELYARRGAVSNDDGAAPSNIPELRDAASNARNCPLMKSSSAASRCSCAAGSRSINSANSA